MHRLVRGRCKDRRLINTYLQHLAAGGANAHHTAVHVRLEQGREPRAVCRTWLTGAGGAEAPVAGALRVPLQQPVQPIDGKLADSRRSPDQGRRLDLGGKLRQLRHQRTAAALDIVQTHALRLDGQPAAGRHAQAVHADAAAQLGGRPAGGKVREVIPAHEDVGGDGRTQDKHGQGKAAERQPAPPGPARTGRCLRCLRLGATGPGRWHRFGWRPPVRPERRP